MKKLKMWVLLLSIFSISLLSFSYASHQIWHGSKIWYGDLRDYYPFGMYIRTEKLNYEPDSFTVLENDTYIEQAIASGNKTWVQQDNPNSTYVTSGFPEYILWTPNGFYYFVHQAFVDGIPSSWKWRQFPPPIDIIKLLGVLWGGTFVMGFLVKRRKDGVESKKPT